MIVAVMTQASPNSTLEFMSHMVVELKAYMEVEEPAWHLYDEAFREKMVAMGVRQWKILPRRLVIV